ncbi:MAG: hypothetical protein IJT04_01310 [Bacteroidales bacterium]|nr:hypothetical protein [Bacteroidales bacterium]
MKKLLSLFVLIFMGLLVFAQVPQKFSYQAVVRDAGNNLITNHAVGVQISILQGGVNGAVVYMESQTAVTNANGLMTLQIGSGTVLSGDFAAIDWAAGPYFLKTETDPNGGSNYTIAGTQQLLSVPYALYAGSSANGFSGDYNDLTNKPTIPTVPENLSDFNNDLGLATVATTGSYNDLTNQPEIPTVPANLSDFNNDLGLATVATTGSYNDLTNIPEEQVLSISNDTIYLTGGSFVKLPAATVGFSGDYNDLTNKQADNSDSARKFE